MILRTICNWDETFSNNYAFFFILKFNHQIQERARKECTQCMKMSIQILTCVNAAVKTPTKETYPKIQTRFV